ncbi:hypothetical protein KFZ58_04270 [Virgibacillus sp. NKC19-16]|nr:hypothetical protein [Virgibacillus sp. NKC19-16]UJL47142.1 hypothetical protein KFZ58_04270 [Virgibacillus sp. NKC19-16]
MYGCTYAKGVELVDLKNQSRMASIINDTDVQDEICSNIDKLMSEMYQYK